MSLKMEDKEIEDLKTNWHVPEEEGGLPTIQKLLLHLLEEVKELKETQLELLQQVLKLQEKR